MLPVFGFHTSIPLVDLNLPKNASRCWSHLNPKPYLEVSCIRNLLSNWIYNPSISRVTVLVGLLIRI